MKKISAKLCATSAKLRSETRPCSILMFTIIPLLLVISGLSTEAYGAQQQKKSKSYCEQKVADRNRAPYDLKVNVPFAEINQKYNSRYDQYFLSSIIYRENKEVSTQLELKFFPTRTLSYILDELYLFLPVSTDAYVPRHSVLTPTSTDGVFTEGWYYEDTICIEDCSIDEEAELLLRASCGTYNDPIRVRKIIGNNDKFRARVRVTFLKQIQKAQPYLEIHLYRGKELGRLITGDPAQINYFESVDIELKLTDSYEKDDYGYCHFGVRITHLKLTFNTADNDKKKSKEIVLY